MQRESESGLEAVPDLKASPETISGDSVNGWLDASARPWCAELEAHAGAIREEMERLAQKEVWFIWGTGNYSHNFTRSNEARDHRYRGPQPQGANRLGPGSPLAPFRPVSQGQADRRELRALPPDRGGGRARAAHGQRRFSPAWNPAIASTPTRATTAPCTRTHLGLRIPAGECALRVGGETRRWESGKTLMFDDTHMHDAWNLTPEHRIVLIVDTLNHNAPLTRIEQPSRRATSTANTPPGRAGHAPGA